MNLKKAKAILAEDSETPIKTVKLIEKVIEALAEPDEGEIPKLEELLNLQRKLNASMDRFLECRPPTPALKFGDLVENEGGERGIFQRHLGDSKMCWVLKVDSSGDLVDRHWNVEGLKLLQRGLCDVSLGKIRDKLRSKG